MAISTFMLSTIFHTYFISLHCLHILQLLLDCNFQCYDAGLMLESILADKYMQPVSLGKLY